MSESIFRGLKGILEIKAQIEPLVEFYARFKPEVKELVLRKSDYDLIARWPKAASSIDGMAVTHNGVFYRGLRLTYDTGEGRYSKQAVPQQEVIE